MDQTHKASSLMPSEPTPEEASSLHRIIAELSPLPPDARRRLIQTVCTFFGVPTGSREHFETFNDIKEARQPTTEKRPAFMFSESEDLTVKQFLLDKSPETDVERVACLAYYLAHHRGTPHFKTKDITAINTESAHRRLSNTAFAVENATKMGYLVPSIKGSKQLSAAGERFVATLPNREEAKAIMAKMRSRGGRSNKKGLSEHEGR